MQFVPQLLIDEQKQQCVCVPGIGWSWKWPKYPLEDQNGKLNKHFLLWPRKQTADLLVEKPILSTSKESQVSLVELQEHVVHRFWLMALFIMKLSFQANWLTNIPLGDFAVIEGASPLKTYGMMVEPGLVVLPWHCGGTHCFISAAIFGYKNIAVVFHPCHSTDLIPCDFFFFLRLKSQLQDYGFQYSLEI